MLDGVTIIPSGYMSFERMDTNSALSSQVPDFWKYDRQQYTVSFIWAYNHWSCIVFDSISMEVHCFDSLTTCGHNPRVIVMRLKQFIRLPETKLRVFSYPVQQQRDDHSCGVFALWFISKFLRGVQANKMSGKGPIQCDEVSELISTELSRAYIARYREKIAERILSS
jgi:Ulp1 family protease